MIFIKDKYVDYVLDPWEQAILKYLVKETKTYKRYGMDKAANNGKCCRLQHEKVFSRYKLNKIQARAHERSMRPLGELREIDTPMNLFNEGAQWQTISCVRMHFLLSSQEVVSNLQVRSRRLVRNCCGQLLLAQTTFSQQSR